MIIFKSVKWKNLLSTGNSFTTIFLDKQPTTLIVGDNGSGKSTILDALTFALFNKPFRIVKKAQLVNSVNNSETVVEVNFEIGTRKYRVMRGIKPNKFEIYCNDKMVNQDASSRDYQKYLEQNILKLNYRSFTQVVILGNASFIPFMQLRSVHRREVVEEILDIDIDENHSLAKKKLGVVGQEVNFNQFEKVGDIIRNQAGYYGLGFRKSKENAKYYMKKLDIWDKRNEQARKLSGGMKRRIMVAKALVNNPELLILDEPTAGVDIELRRSLWDFLTEINNNGTSIILTTHYLEEAERLCRNIAIIDSGEIVENTSMQELLTRLEEETFIFDLLEPINKLPEISGFEMILENPKRIKVTVDKEQGLNAVFKSLSELGIEISSMRNETGRLEELFLGLVEPSLKEKD